MDCLTVGCVLAVVSMPVAVVLAAILSAKTGKQRKRLDGVNLEALSPAERVKWQTMRTQVEKTPLSVEQERDLGMWERRR